MKKFLFIVTVILFFVSCDNAVQGDVGGKIKIILETDIGNDVDDALAMDMLHKYIDAGKVDVLGIMINKNGEFPAEFTDIMDTWYGHPDIPIGIIRDGADCENDAMNYARVVCEMKDTTGAPLFKRTMDSYSSLPDAHLLYRKILGEQADSSVVIVSIGFSTNLARLMDTPADQYSSLTGMELIRSKVKKLVTMAGCFNNPEHHEYNVVKDVPSAIKVFEDWPGTIVTSPFEVGIDILYPAYSIENDFNWSERHPVVEAYKCYLPMPYDRPTWDLTALLYAAGHEDMFSVSPSGHIYVSDDGSTSFVENPESNRYYLIADESQKAVIRQYFVDLISQTPANQRQDN